MVPKSLVPLDNWSLEYSLCLEGQAMRILKYRDRIGWGPFVHGNCLSKGINFMGIVCPGGQEVGDRKSRDQMGSGANVSQPNL